MRIPKIDLRTPDQRPPERRASRFVITFVIVFCTIAAAAFSSNVIFSDHPVLPWGNATFLGQLRTLVRSADKKLQGEHDDQVNILILGIGGEGHDGPYLADTILLASYQPSTDKLALVSIPRDLVLETPEFGSVKINAIDAYAEARAPGSGPAATAKALGTMLGEPIAYWTRIDFRGFERAIEAVGGVDVTVDRAFTDDQFPISSSDIGVKSVSFAAGTQHMDGKTALNFSRSRHGTNGEGSDFARSKRQEKILVALRDKLLRAGTLLNPFTIDALVGTVQDNVKTNLETWEILRLAREAGNVQAADIALRVMSDANVLAPATGPDGAFLLVPKGGDWAAVRAFATSALDQTAPSEPARRAVRVDVQNGTSIPGLANKTANDLIRSGFTVVHVGNAAQRTYEKSVIYDLTAGRETDALVKIRSLVDANVALTIPDTLTASAGDPPKPVDFILVIGQNASL